jgi:hypothetical protein
MSFDIVTTVITSAASYNMASLATIKDELNIASNSIDNDAWLTRALTQVSKAMMSATNRVFAPEFIQDVFYINRNRSQYPSGLREVQLSRFPVLAIASVVQVSSSIGTTATLVNGTDFTVDYKTGRMIRIDATTGREMYWEPDNLTIQYVAGYGASVQETKTVPATPYQVTVTQSATFSCDQSVTYSSGIALKSVLASPTLGQYVVNPLTGLYTFNADDVGQSMTFTYATSSPPSDLEEATLRLVTARFRSKGRDPTLTMRETPGVGIERFWFGGAPGQKGAFPPDVQSLLSHYHTPVMA